jgi:hypothetical protein
MVILKEDLMRASDSDGPTYRRLFPQTIITILTLVISTEASYIAVAEAIERANVRRVISGV